MGELFHIGLGHAIFLVGLILMFARNAELEAVKNIILSYIFGIAILFFYLFCNYGTRTTNFIKRNECYT